MKVGVTLPQTEMSADPGAIREYAQTVEALGFDHIMSLDHVLGANSDSRPGWTGPYDHNDLIHETFVLLGYLAAVTERVELVSAVLVLPQRQTALVAKQAAEVDVLSGGRMRLGIGVGWNDVEFEALSEDFHDRGRRCEEQIEVMRMLWSQETVTFNGKWHTITDAGINPLPPGRTVPVWIGGGAEPVLERIGRMGDGWFPQLSAGEEARAAIERLHGYAKEAGRDPADVGIEGRIIVSSGSPEDWVNEASAWRDLGATHVAARSVGAGMSFPEGHSKTIQQFKEALDAAGIA